MDSFFFLNSEGDNVGLSEGLKMQKRYYLGPLEVEINRLDRVVGPEQHMEYVENEDWWNYNINQICERIEGGWDMPPLIAENRNGIFSIRDGNHRLGALEKLKKEKYFVIIWDNNSLENMLKALSNESEEVS
ncbi:ParB N-terminal domain-containing protein [Paenibacillus sp. Soil750]|uniref:ParB N-terminal domain-containing protein n=1 Tax=Paenibacillus sp. Soil750 TaxID=1736398 RepID=UPI0009E945BA|nr:ParB N-terminal domain-containing protein [Paenibacillus sp. Soil750]